MHRRSFLQGIAAGGLSLPAAGAVEARGAHRLGRFDGSATSPQASLVIDSSRTLVLSCVS